MEQIRRVREGFKKLRHLVKLAVIFWVVSFVMFILWWACGILVNNTIRTPPEPLEYKVIEFSVCRGWSNTGAAEKQQIFHSDEKEIFACGHLQTNRPIGLSVDWHYEGQHIYRDFITDVQDRFLSKLTPTEKEFPVGNYELRLVIGRKIEGRSEFKITPP
jgi:hypothetical protein